MVSEILDQKAIGAIRLSLASTIAFNVSREKTIKDLMAVLSKMYEKPSASNKVFLTKQLFNLKMADNGSIAGHLNKFNTRTSQLESDGSISKTKSERWFCCPVC